MKKILALLLLLPALVFAGTMEVKVADTLATPVGMTIVDSLNTANVQVYAGAGNKRAAVISAAPINYEDSNGVYRPLNLAVQDISLNGYTHRIRPTRRFGIDWNESGSIRYIAYGVNNGLPLGGIEFIPAFDQTNVDIEFILSGNGIKANYTLLNSSAPDSLTWNWKAKATPNWNGEVTKAKLADWLDGKLAYPTAFDANGDSVGIIRTKTAGSVVGDSLMGTMTYFAQTGGATYPIVVDPSVVDTLDPDTADVGLVYNSIKRDTVAYTGKETGDIWVTGTKIANDWWRRSFFTFDIVNSDVAAASTVDSARFVMQLDHYTAAQEIVNYMVFGTYSGNQPTAFNQFQDWAASGAYPITNRFASPLQVTNGFSDDTTVSKLMSQAVLDSLLAADTLRLILIDSLDVYARASGDMTFKVDWTGLAPYMIVYYDATPATLSHVTTLADYDTLKVTGLAPYFELVAQYDSSGGGLDSVGMALYKWGVPADTIFVVDDSTGTGGYVTGWSEADSTFTITYPIEFADTLDADTAYVMGAFAVTGGTRTFSDVEDTIRTYITASSALTSIGATEFVVVNLGGEAVFPFTPNTTPITVRGIEYYIADSVGTDTTLSAGGPFAAGVFSVSTTVAADTFYVFRSLFTDVLGPHLSDWDTINTTQTGQEIADTIAVTDTVTVTDTVEVNTGSGDGRFGGGRF